MRKHVIVLAALALALLGAINASAQTSSDLTLYEVLTFNTTEAIYSPGSLVEFPGGSQDFYTDSIVGGTTAPYVANYDRGRLVGIPGLYATTTLTKVDIETQLPPNSGLTTFTAPDGRTDTYYSTTYISFLYRNANGTPACAGCTDSAGSELYPPLCSPSVALTSAPLGTTSLLSATAGSCNPPPPPPTCDDYMKKINIAGGTTVDIPRGRGAITIQALANGVGINLQQLASLCGYDHFNWLSTITSYYLYGKPSQCFFSIIGVVRCTGFDPALGGNFGSGQSDFYPPYWDEVNCLFCSSQYYYGEGENQTIFVDMPNFLLAGWSADFTTQWIGVRGDHTYQILEDRFGYPAFTVRWKYTQTMNYPFCIGPCATIILANTDPNLAGGGQIDFLGLGEEVANPLLSGDSCNGNFNGTFSGNVNVTAGQNCVFTDNCEITGNVTVNGGTFNLGCAVDGNVAVSSGNLVLSPAARVDGNVQVYQGSTTLGPGVGIGGNVSIKNLNGTAQNTICLTQIGRNLQAQYNASPVEIGGLKGCPGNTIGGNLGVSSNTAAVQIDYNTITGNLSVDSDTAMTDVSGNSVDGNMECENNSTLTYLNLNKVTGRNQGQCAASP